MTLSIGRPLLAKLVSSAVLVSALVMATGATAQTPAPERIGVRGTITALDGEVMKIRSNRGEDLTVHLLPQTQVRGVTLAKVADIKPGSYIGSAAVPQPDGTLKALEIHVFPPEMAGTGDGHRPFDLTKESTMTNGSVGGLVTSNGRSMTINYKGGQKTIVVPDDVPIVNLLPGDRSLLSPGVKVVLRAEKAEDGRLNAQSISAGKDGVTPPM
ncbi:DUF5666 domain-containing protein [Pseudomonas syringae]|uniref:DUF5666 domain-containing protein n=1 Tax=Pseudomonas syringae TaxID=317 RepID=A0A085VQ58_PSESX|nr:hypothetical protein IV01_03175 [Pseudomonas syringae]